MTAEARDQAAVDELVPGDARDTLADAGAIEVLRAGIAASPEIKVGLALTVAMAVATAVGKLMVPILIDQIVDRGITGPDGFRPEFVYPACTVALVIIGGVLVAGRATFLRLVRTAEDTLYALRVRTFAHIHRLSVAEHTENKKGEYVSRVTSDIDMLAQFTQWGAVAWIVDSVLVVGTLAIMFVYSWQLTLVVMAIFIVLVPVLLTLNRRQLVAYDIVRTRVADTLAEVSETVSGADVVRAYGLHDRARARLQGVARRHYRAHMGAARYFSLMFPLAEFFGALAVIAVVLVGAEWGPGWGLQVGDLIAFVFLVNLLLMPIAEIGEVLDQTQTALAGWRKVLLLLQVPPDIVEPEDGRALPTGPVALRVEGVRFRYRTGAEVLHGLHAQIPAGQKVAVVGETGSGKTTLAKLLCRLADPSEGRITVAGVDLRDVAADARHRSIRMVPQDGFLFATTVRENVRSGRPGASDAAVDAAFDALELRWWVDRLPGGLDTEVGERGENLSVGERQLVALARAQLADPGLLILDEATSSVDPETEVALTHALDRLAEGRTTVSVAHRLSTAERADLVLVFDDGRIVERGSHDELVRAGGVYAGLYDSWLGNTRTRAA